jgi:hypothetical protein
MNRETAQTVLSRSRLAKRVRILEMADTPSILQSRGAGARMLRRMSYQGRGVRQRPGGRRTT